MVAIAGVLPAAVQSQAASTAAAAYGWPLAPFDRQHPVRGFLGDPRIRGASRDFHWGIDIVGRTGTPVFAVEAGKVYINGNRALSVVARDRSHSFAYWHIVPAVSGHTWVTRHQLLGWIDRGWGHVHFAEFRGGSYMNPLRPGALRPYRDTTRPRIAKIVVVSSPHGRVAVLADAYDLPDPPVAGAWAGEPVAPALLQWRLLHEGRVERGWRTAADFRLRLPTRRRFASVYAPSTRQNHPHEPGVYWYRLFGAWRPPDGMYELDVRASDTRANVGERRFELVAHRGRILEVVPEYASPVLVRSDEQFRSAVAALRDAGGTILLLPHAYRELVVPPRGVRPLEIVGGPGVEAEHVRLDRTQHVTLAGVTITPRRGNALLEVDESRHVVLRNLRLTAEHTRWSVSMHLWRSSDVAIRRTVFTHCGDRSPAWSNCLMPEHADRVLVADSWFHDCFGCDFIHGRFGTGLTLLRNRFERALPCSIGRNRCGHQDLIELFAGRKLRVVGNTFGVYKRGGAQLYLTDAIDDVRIANNVFLATDPRVPGYRVRVAMIIGSRGFRRVPHDVLVVNNTILSGAPRVDGYAGSIRMSSLYGAVPKRNRPILANNVIALLTDRNHVCSEVQASIRNVVLNGKGCSGSDRVDRAGLDRSARPTSRSTALIDRASRRYAPRADITGRPRGRAPDIGAYEYAGASRP